MSEELLPDEKPRANPLLIIVISLIILVPLFTFMSRKKEENYRVTEKQGVYGEEIQIEDEEPVEKKSQTDDSVLKEYENSLKNGIEELKKGRYNKAEEYFAEGVKLRGNRERASYYRGISIYLQDSKRGRNFFESMSDKGKEGFYKSLGLAKIALIDNSKDKSSENLVKIITDEKTSEKRTE